MIAMLKILMILMECSGNNKRLQQKDIMDKLEKSDDGDYHRLLTNSRAENNAHVYKRMYFQMISQVPFCTK